MEQLPELKKALEDWIQIQNDYNAAILELHQHLIKTSSETAEARIKLVEAGKAIRDYVADLNYYAAGKGRGEIIN